MTTDILQPEAALHDAADFDAFFASAAAGLLMEKIIARMARADIVSFDVFDTVLLRDGKSELHRFADFATRFADGLTAAGGAPVVSARAALVARIYSASAAYQLSAPVQGTTEGRLDDIAWHMMHSLRLPEAAAADWIEAELSVETEQLRRSDFAHQIMESAVKAGKRVIFVSDMYLSEAHIRRLLDACGVDMRLVSRVYSTADTTVNKRSGTIFARIARDLATDPGRFLHLGDSRVSDYLQPGLAGWAAQYLPLPRGLAHARRDDHLATCAAQFGDAHFPLPMSVPSV